MPGDENLVLNAAAASPGGITALAIAWAACARPLQIAETARSLVMQGLLRRREGQVDVYETLGTTPLAAGDCFECAAGKVQAPAILCARCTKLRGRASAAEIETMAAFVAFPARSLNLADLAARSRASATQVEALMLAWTQARVVALDAAAVEPAWSSPGADRFAAAGEVARSPRVRGPVPKKLIMAVGVVLLIGFSLGYARLQQARKDASNRYWSIKSGLGDHEALLTPLLQGMDAKRLKQTVGLSVGLELSDHLVRAKMLNDMVVAQLGRGTTLDVLTQPRVESFDSKFSASLADYNVYAERYESLRTSLLGRVLCLVSRCTVFAPQASPF